MLEKEHIFDNYNKGKYFLTNFFLLLIIVIEKQS